MTDKNEMPIDVHRLANEHVWQGGDGQSTSMGVRTRVRVENAFIAGYEANKNHMQAQLDEVIDMFESLTATCPTFRIGLTKLKEMRGE